MEKSLLKQIIQEYRDADVATTLLWSFLRGRQKESAGFTPLEMLVPWHYCPLPVSGQRRSATEIDCPI
jgi:hypothetical protein